MKLIESILTNNPCYTAGRKITVKGLMLHSVGCPQPSASVFVKLWNKASYNSACVHAFIDGNTGDVYQTLPWNHRGWHGGGSSNNTHIGVEMCEPATIKYTGGASWKETGDGTNTKATVLRTYKAAVELFAMLCKKFDLDPLADGVIVSHKEGHARGIASNHGDPEHIWTKFGLSMAQFRKDVKAAMGGSSGSDTAKTEDKAASTGAVRYYVQAGAFKEKAKADAHAAKIKAAGFAVLVKKVGSYYKVQTGAFDKKANAEAQAKQLKAKGFDAFVTTDGGSAASTPAPIDKGDVVQFAGGPHYTSANASSQSGCPKAGPARVTAICKGAKHPYHIVHTDKQSTVYGWVDADKVSK